MTESGPRPLIYVALEGVDGIGKTTMVTMVADRLRRAGLTVQTKPEFPNADLTRDLGAALDDGLFLGEVLGVAPASAFFYMLYVETLGISEVGRAAGGILLADRCLYTQAIYQSFFASIPRSAFDPARVRCMLNEFYTMFALAVPDLVLVLDAPEEVFVHRLEQREQRTVTPAERDTLRVFQSVYRQFADAPEAMLVDATTNAADLADNLAEIIELKAAKAGR